MNTSKLGRRQAPFIIYVATVIFGFTSLSWGASLTRHAVGSDFDRRPTDTETLSENPLRERAERRLRERLPKLEMQRSSRVGTPRWLSARDGFLSGKRGQGRGMDGALGVGPMAPNQPRQIIKAFVNEHAAVFWPASFARRSHR